MSILKRIWYDRQQVNLALLFGEDFRENCKMKR